VLNFRCIALPTETAERFRSTRIDDRGSPAIVRELAPGSRGPCRHCLRFARPGEPLLLVSYDVPRPLGVYWTPSPIFIHAERCERFMAVNEIPEMVRGSRSYDLQDMCLYDLGHVSEGTEIDEPLQWALNDPRTAYVNIHTAKPGCFFCRVERC
jgi:Protein of unknown function (DUF1203)